MNTLKPTPNELEFFNAYCEAINFTDTDDIGQPDSGTELHPYFYRESLIDCLAFYSHVRYMIGDRLKKAGHDFWFTRNGHGVGFWEDGRGWSDYEQIKFTKVAESFGAVDSYFEEIKS